MSENESEIKIDKNEIWGGLAKAFDGARDEAVKLPGGHELKHGEVWGALAGAAVVGAGILLVNDPTRQVVENAYRGLAGGRGEVVGEKPTFLQFAKDLLYSRTEASKSGSSPYAPISYGGSYGREWEKNGLRALLGVNETDITKLGIELSKMEIHRQFRNITSLALAGVGFVSGVLAVTAEKAKERVVWSDTIGPLLAKGIRAMNNVSEQP